MKAQLSVLFALAAIALLHAQDTTNQVATPPAANPLASLTDADQQRLAAAYKKAVAANPQLEKDQQKLKVDAETFHAGGKSVTAEQFIAEATAYQKEVEEAMVKADPGVEPLLAKIHAAEAEMKKQLASEVREKFKEIHRKLQEAQESTNR